MRAVSFLAPRVVIPNYRKGRRPCRPIDLVRIDTKHQELLVSDGLTAPMIGCLLY